MAACMAEYMAEFILTSNPRSASLHCSTNCSAQIAFPQKQGRCATEAASSHCNDDER